MAVVIAGGRVLTMTGVVYDPGFVEFDAQGKITRVGAGNPPASPDYLDATGKLVLPGFVDAHTHAGILEEGAPDAGDDLNEISDPVTPQLRAIDGINPADPAFGDALSGGVTTVCVLPGSANVIGGVGAVLKTALPWADRLVQVTAGMKCALGENPKRTYGGRQKAPVTRMAAAALLREALLRTRIYAEKKAKGTLPEIDFRWEAMQPVLNGEIPLRVHAHRADDLLTALRIGKEFNVTLILEHCTEGHLIAAELAAAGVSAVVGPALVNRAKVEMREISPATAGVLQRAGVPVALTTDHPVVPVRYLAICAGLAVQHGMDELAALQAISLTPARLLGLDQRVGSLEKGKDADFVIWSGHPFDTRSRVEQVWVKGRPVWPPG
ncbi:MAG: amidohydrolase [Heliobacteriaceae bacterium]|nr:amidohydrolase [Heliobacteriaceae bacterium]